MDMGSETISPKSVKWLTWALRGVPLGPYPPKGLILEVLGSIFELKVLHFLHLFSFIVDVIFLSESLPETMRKPHQPTPSSQRRKPEEPAAVSRKRLQLIIKNNVCR